MADFNSMDEVNIFYDMIQSDVHTLGSCIVYGSSSKEEQKYIRVKKHIHPSKHIRAYVHQVALLKKIGCIRLPEGHEPSHLCHNKQCVNMDHLVSEPHHVNMSRVACSNERLLRRMLHFCFGHEGYAQCM